MATSSKVVDNGSSREEIVQALRELDEDADDDNEILFARHVTEPMMQRFQFRRLHKHVLTADPVKEKELKELGFNSSFNAKAHFTIAYSQANLGKHFFFKM